MAWAATDRAWRPSAVKYGAMERWDRPGYVHGVHGDSHRRDPEVVPDKGKQPQAVPLAATSGARVLPTKSRKSSGMCRKRPIPRGFPDRRGQVDGVQFYGLMHGDALVPRDQW